MNIPFDGIGVGLYPPEKNAAPSLHEARVCPETSRLCNSHGMCHCEPGLRLEAAFDALPDVAWTIP